MQRFIFRAALVTLLMTVMLNAQAQDPDTTRPTSIDPELLAWENSTTPREYTIGQVQIAGIKHLDTAIVLSISGLQTGQKFVYPGTDIFSKAITNMWRQKLFGDVQIFATAIKGNVLDFEIHVQELPRLASFEFVGIKKSDKEELAGKIGLTRGVIVTENMRRNIVEVTTKFYREKGFQN